MTHFWRFSSPSLLLLALLLFPLPWVEIQCGGEVTKHASSGPVRSVHMTTIYSQSGLQAMLGQWSWGEYPLEEETEEDRLKREEEERELSRKIRLSWLMAVYAIALLAGAVVGYTTRLSRRRIGIIALLAAVGLGLVTIQVIRQFPLVRAVFSEEIDQRTPPQPVNLPNEDGQPELRYVVRYTTWFWLAQLAVAGCPVLLGAEWWFVHRRRGIARAGIPDSRQTMAWQPVLPSLQDQPLAR